MGKNKLLLLRLYVVIAFLLPACPASGQLLRYNFTQSKMGAPCTISFYAPDARLAGELANACFSLVDSLAAIFTDYDDSSELNRLCRHTEWNKLSPAAVPVSPALYDILSASQKAFQLSGGSFDISLGPLTRLWRKARAEKIFPTDSTVRARLALTGFRYLRIDTTLRAVILLQAGMQLDLGGIAQGYIAQKIIDLLKQRGINAAMANLSGDIVTTGAPPGSLGWKIGINVPQSDQQLLPRYLQISDRAVTTSGDLYQFMEFRGKRYSHIIHPATGYGITSQRNVTVIAADGTMADWLTKACSILPAGKAQKLAKRLGAELLITELKKGKLRMHATRGFHRYWQTAAR